MHTLWEAEEMAEEGQGHEAEESDGLGLAVARPLLEAQALSRQTKKRDERSHGERHRPPFLSGLAKKARHRCAG